MLDAIALAALHASSLISAPIIDGAEAPDDLAVLALTGLGGHPFCSGVLVAPSVVATAAHCVVDTTRQLRAPAAVRFVAPDGDELDVEIAWLAVSPLYDREALVADVALIGLAAAAPVPPIEVLAPAQDHVVAGNTAIFIGFGFTELGATGVVGERHRREAAVTRRDEDVLYYGEVTCNGDSGGAVLVEDGGVARLAGLVSAGPIGCYFYGLASAISPHRAWIEAAAARPEGTCAADARCVPGCGDLDCTCVADGSCGACGDDPGLPCDDPPPDPESGGCGASGGSSGAAIALAFALLAAAHRRARSNIR